MMIKLHIPGEPQGKQRPRKSCSGYMYTPDKTRKYEERVRTAYRLRYGNKMQWENGKTQLKMLVLAGYKIPEGASKGKKYAMQKGEILPTKKPDADNILKVIADGLNGLCYYDDKQIVDVTVRKYYTDQPGVDVMIWEKNNAENLRCVL